MNRKNPQAYVIANAATAAPLLVWAAATDWTGPNADTHVIVAAAVFGLWRGFLGSWPRATKKRSRVDDVVNAATKAVFDVDPHDPHNSPTRRMRHVRPPDKGLPREVKEPEHI